ncbi:hypothetical protein OH738_03540 [Streptomyces hirsutus]|uniref:Uncharacterized protein n=1 Tax=Streptomyces hirsutus TaxID=35620 RepID=A0ABZ1GWZ9_9ACTN|nr:hypothetical protein [Streptomyces hirsutus]WSD10665.1 hypothetical protein OIE73_36500 [Streptomyces hirsutus]WTD15989.1 hypothetical protein OH738_03540 [Streptomyces hirsutus]WTD73325.1 hypothetical protein OHB56_04835 [Streptomyces sp. NBC_01635]
MTQDEDPHVRVPIAHRHRGAVREAIRVLQVLDRTLPTGAITVTTSDRLTAIAGHALSR